MKEYKTNDLRNIAIVGHGNTGKTSLVDACLFNAGASKRLGRVDEDTSLLDFDPEETKRKMTINSKLAAAEWAGCKLNFLDTPGYPDFVGEAKGALAAADAALIVLSASDGIAAGTELSWQYAEDGGIPRAIFINKMDRERADFHGTVEALRARFGNNVVPLQLPIGKEAAFKGIVSLVSLHNKTKDEPQSAAPADMAAELEEARHQLIEAAADCDEALMEKYLEEEEISEAEIATALVKGISEGTVYPVFCGSAYQNIGMKELMNAIVELMPSPEGRTVKGVNPADDSPVECDITSPFTAQVFKTVVDPLVGRQSFIRIFSGDMSGDVSYYDVNTGKDVRLGSLQSMQGKQTIALPAVHAGDIVVVAKLTDVKTGDTLCEKAHAVKLDPIAYPAPMLEMAVYSKEKGNEDKVFGALTKQAEEDPTIRLVKDAETKEMLLYGIGEVHLDVLADKIKRKFSADMVVKQPLIAYRETVRKTVKVEGKHKKQSGGHGQYGHVWLEIGPSGAGEGNVFTETIFGGSVPRNFIPAVEKGTTETLAGGILAGYPVVDVKVNLFDGSYHPVDSSEMAFKTATALALKKGVMDAAPVLLEPIVDITVTAPENNMGDIMGKLNSKRGRIAGMEGIGKGFSQIKAQVPAAELYKFATDLRSMTQGRGSYSLAFSHYEEVPAKMAEEVIAAAKAAKEDQ